MLTVYVFEHFGHLRLRQAFAVQAAGKAFALILLLAEDCQYAGVEVAVSKKSVDFFLLFETHFLKQYLFLLHILIPKQTFAYIKIR